jgi:hypothetical protein
LRQFPPTGLSANYEARIVPTLGGPVREGVLSERAVNPTRTTTGILAKTSSTTLASSGFRC